MKGPNPFALWEDDPESISGRKDESRIFNGFVNSVLSKQGGVLIVSGAPGVGKTMLLRHFKEASERAGLVSPYANAERGEGEADIAGKIAQDAQLPGPEHDLESLTRALEKSAARGHFGAIVFIDDLDRARKSGELVKDMIALARAGWRKKNIGFVVSSTKELGTGSGPAAQMPLGPLDEHDAREFMEKALKKGPPKMGEECLQSMLSDTGGNPRLLKTVCRVIYDKLRDNEKIITKGHYLGYLPLILGALSREWFGRMYQETPQAERRILQALAKNEEGMHVSDVAKKLGKPLGPVTALTKRLLEEGQITRIDRGKYKVFSKLYARYVNQRS